MEIHLYRSRRLVVFGTLVFVAFAAMGSAHALPAPAKPDRTKFNLLDSFGCKPPYGPEEFKPAPRPPKIAPPPEDFTFRKRMHRMHREDRESRMENLKPKPQKKP